MSCFRPFACLLGVGSVGLAMVAAGCGGAGNVTISDDGGGGGDGALDGTMDGKGSGDGSGGDGHPGTDGGGKDGAGGDATVEGGSGEGGTDASEAGKDATGGDGTTSEGSTEGGGVESGVEAGVESGPEAGVEAGPEAGPEAGVEAGPEAGPEAGVVCDAVNGTTLTVDPKNGQDVTGNGSGLSGGVATGSCAFKTITYALGHLGTATTVQVLATAHLGTTGAGLNGETFPLAVPAGITVTGASGNVPTIDVPGGSANAGVGFLLATAGSVVRSFALVGSSVGIHGVLATTGSTAATSIDAVDVSGMATAGIRVDGTGQLTINAGTQCHGNGVGGQTELSGLHVTGTGQAFITGGGAGSAPIKFYSNGQDGILVDGAGSITLGGTAAGLTGDVMTTLNAGSGLVIHQEVPASGNPPLNTVGGLVSVSNTLDGAELFANSNVLVRSSVFLANARNGVLVASTGTGAAQTFNVGNLDLGDDANGNAGLNTLQDQGSNANALAGVCLDIRADQGQSLAAAGNTWITSGGTVVDCSAATGMLTESATGKTCSGAVDVGGPGLSGGVSLNANAVNVAMCGCGLVGTTCQ
ncbi:MAG TPA: hypothetical protein VIF09_01460 [Polyangiaceae bacterium]|jgi:hypothetical protein